MNFEQARFNMVEQQIRTWEVLDQRVLDLILATPREDFVPAEYKRLAYADTEVPLPDDQTMLAPKLVARLLQVLQVQRDDLVLEIGTGSAYLTALLAELGRHVVSVEISATLHERAKQLLAAKGIANVDLHCGDGIAGWSADGPYDVIVMTGSVSDLDLVPRGQLKIGGRLFAVTGTEPAMEAKLLIRRGDDTWLEESLFETVVPALKGAEPVMEFVL